jgi:shikimate kinase
MSVITPGRNIVLAGMMGTGKSTVGRLLAQRLGSAFFDTDDIVEAEASRGIRDIFAESGERAFRDLESEAVRGVSTLRGRVIAVGGGALQRPGNLTHLRSTGDIVLLDAEPATLAERVEGLADHERPLLDGSEDLAGRLATLRADRDAAYRAAATGVIDTTGRTPEEVVELVLDWARSRPGLLAADERTP